ncbi:hypothetical protein Pmani_034701 [Petrolisthes manimaculis]|uniref:Uncharacterized protein n=1 Tax=Petrolisthes manimaculis TaxID=1843537 RepID=A0AAE1NM18_9EUCA|nr:hypothetical protein Pmani_034701 [Petrolisthes manimaculis]
MTPCSFYEAIISAINITHSMPSPLTQHETPPIPDLAPDPLNPILPDLATSSRFTKALNRPSSSKASLRVFARLRWR